MVKKRKNTYRSVFPVDNRLVDLKLEDKGIGNIVYNTKRNDLCMYKDGKWQIIKHNKTSLKTIKKDKGLALIEPNGWVSKFNIHADECIYIKINKSNKLLYHIYISNQSSNTSVPYKQITESCNKEALFKFLNVVKYFCPEYFIKEDTREYIDKINTMVINKSFGPFDTSKNIIDSLNKSNIYGNIIKEDDEFQTVSFGDKIDIVVPNNIERNISVLAFQLEKLKCFDVHYSKIIKTIKILSGKHKYKLYFKDRKDDNEILLLDYIDIEKINVDDSNDVDEEEIKLQNALKYGYKSTQEKVMYWFFYDQPYHPDREVWSDKQRKNETDIQSSPTKSRKRDVLRKPTDRALQGRLNVEIVYPSGKVYSGRLRATIDDIAVIEPSVGDRVAWLCDLKDVRDLRVIDLSKIPAERLYHTAKNIEWLKSLKYINLYDY